MSPGPRPLVEQISEPARFWVRFRPRVWPGSAPPWCDLAELAIGGAGEADRPTGVLDPRLEDVLYLPPVADELASWRDEVARTHAERGTPVLVQVRPGDLPPAAPVTVVVDLLEAVLRDEPVAVPPGARAAAWPSLPLPPKLRDRLPWLARELAGAGVEVLQAVALELAPRDRRRIAERVAEDEGLALFHAPRVTVGELDAIALEAGMRPLLDRPIPAAPFAGRNLEISGWLAAAGELALRAGRGPAVAQDWFRAAHEASRSRRELAALAREGNLAVLPWLAPGPRRLVEEAATAPGRPRSLRELEARLLTRGREGGDRGE